MRGLQHPNRRDRSLNPSHIGAYGYARNTTPNIDSIASRGVLFEQAYSPAKYTFEANLSIFTGRRPSEHASSFIYYNETFYKRRLGASEETLAKSLAAAGYRTAAFTTSEVYDEEDVCLLGFGESALYDRRPYDEEEHPMRDAQRWIGAGGSGKPPFFALVHDVSIHYP